MRLQNRFQKGSQSAGDLALSVAFQHKGFMSDPDLLTSQKNGVRQYRLRGFHPWKVLASCKFRLSFGRKKNHQVSDPPLGLTHRHLIVPA